jgi:ribosomal protein L40E
MSFLMSFLGSISSFLFGCSHDNVTRPFTLQNYTYKVCLDCGNELPYSATTMRYLSARQARAQARRSPQTATVLAFEATRSPRETSLRDSKAVA